jgi:hypothetical protein
MATAVKAFPILSSGFCRVRAVEQGLKAKAEGGAGPKVVMLFSMKPLCILEIGGMVYMCDLSWTLLEKLSSPLALL